MIYLSEEEVKSLLNWDDTFKATEAAMRAVSAGTAAISPRVITSISSMTKYMLTMPGYLDDKNYGAWACKVISVNQDNVKKPNPVTPFNVNIMVFDNDTGALKGVLAGIEITSCRTAAASAVATKYLHSHTLKPQKILSIFGCGEEGRAHAKSFYHFFQFEEIRLWNRTTQRAKDLAKELNEKLGTTKFKAFEDGEECAREADVICTTTSPALAPIVKYEWLKSGIHINAVGVVGATSEKHYELDDETYKRAEVYVDNWHAANIELAKLKENGTNMKAEVGEVIVGKVPTPNREQLTIFQSLGMAVEDCAMARMVFDLYVQNQSKPK